MKLRAGDLLSLARRFKSNVWSLVSDRLDKETEPVRFVELEEYLYWEYLNHLIEDVERETRGL